MNKNIRKALFIINKHAGVGYQPYLEGKIINACEKHDVECTIEFTADRGHGITLAQQAAEKGFQWVIASGGDGTLNEVAQGLIHAGLPMGIIPRGSGNGLARHLGISLRISDAIDQLFDSRVISMDAFTINGKFSLNVSGIGFDGHVANMFGADSRRGLIGYITLTLQEFFRFKEFEIIISANGKTFIRNAFIVAIANSSQYGNNARIAPSASVCDGLLHLNILRKVPFYRIDFVYAFFNGSLDKSSFCEILVTNSLQLKTTIPVAFHVDGESCGLSDAFAVRLIPKALHVLVPNKGRNTRV
ncbi:MAG: YegS/Rv2252/BmrU family lipid kinase [Cyclobacteriaceae bacterium]|nr:YegS/Rv2252/BmrU family lipid kinase [Cyclobacteriaceae bacterium]MDH4297257.1 YegS/Rv2252/BmrU family lipid kinase [Cyclobacteriaceae bacterium]MDH5248192.1 YegS/Rv2252/BmrU family lipid kinase [Cyclobacteriaceae bacterium]